MGSSRDDPMDPLVIFATGHWVVSHRDDSRWPGYLMVSARAATPDLSGLDDDALSEFGRVLRDTELLLRRAFAPYKVIFAKLGFTPGFVCHVHAIPVTAALLAEIAAHPGYADEPDGNDALLFVSRVYCERPLDEKELPQLAATIAMLRASHADAEAPA
jgi:diadenosine tetraphosphate (Ap4A) HIT family hydrolase